ncbi:limiting CO2-inducible proteins B/C beta carbonic anhydrase domain-containing protein [Skeletonema marinoi]|uniref:Limiting CO2-inducible proteins B/C beta carbonic anhydrase domain-containing protein n=1 Tax=Skeletonema marinoi TaxID=267567 RepID=A0AAD8Y7X0_9STRA|nr:limiting CO2-inducible proteins B/C beta carbonic anhydrase domain-containing protein [Skeletonema marinoi]|mmetsp:Transcript_4430/g.6452  ORF Transcript_4430/g.6452 Transcript_4430/m.6452 type:complete len:359 (-) Transcript_4430:122-1198(-)
MIGLNKAFSFLLCANLALEAAAFAPSTTKQSHVLRAAADDQVVDEATRNARIMAPISSIMAAVSPSLGLVSPANAAPSASAFEANLRKNFPGALTNSAISLRVAAALRDRGYTPGNTLFGSSLCSDEINDTAESLVGDFQNKLGTDGVFNLGGLGGLPFVGISGMGAFIHHVPASGKIFIVFGPHVGISDKGVVGQIERVGQTSISTSCGAGIGAYKAIMGKKGESEAEAYLGTKDFQEEYIIAKLGDRLDALKGQEQSNESITFLTNKMYDLVWEMMRSEINAYTTKDDFWKECTEVTLLGGIVVNRGHGAGVPGGEDYYQPLMLKSLTKDGESDMYGEVFGDFPALAAPHRAAKYV